MLVTRNLVVRKAAPGETPQQVAYGAVYMPDVVDSQNDFMRADEIRKAAHGFLRRGTTDAIDTHHNNVKNGSHVVESFLTKEGDPDFPIPGTWVVGIHVPDPVLWAQIEKGEIGGLSMEVIARRHEGRDVPTRKLRSATGKATGCTYKTGDHEHTYEIEYGPNGEFMGGRTNEVNGHFHLIRAGKTGVVTEEAADHRHRFSTLEHFEMVPEREEPVAAAKGDDDDQHEEPIFGEWMQLLKGGAIVVAATNGARAGGSRGRSGPRTTYTDTETRQINRNAARSMGALGRMVSTRFRRGGQTAYDRARHQADVSSTARQNRNYDEGRRRDTSELRRAQANDPNDGSGRTWVRGFYRNTPRGQRSWVAGHWAN